MEDYDDQFGYEGEFDIDMSMGMGKPKNRTSKAIKKASAPRAPESALQHGNHTQRNDWSKADDLCRRCGGAGHKAFECPSAPARISGPVVTPTPNPLVSAMGGSAKQRKEQHHQWQVAGLCRRCGGADHRVDGCPFETPTAAHASASSLAPVTTPAPNPNPAQSIFAPPSTHAQRHQWQRAGLCRRCGGADHRVDDCPFEVPSAAQRHQWQLAGLCKHCGEDGHYSNDCPLLTASAAPISASLLTPASTLAPNPNPNPNQAQVIFAPPSTNEQRHQWQLAGLCRRCGGVGHFFNNCPFVTASAAPTSASSFTPAVAPALKPTPHQISKAFTPNIEPKQRREWRKTGLCMRCGDAGHLASGCTLEPYSAASNSAPSVPAAETTAPKSFAPNSTSKQRWQWQRAGLCMRCGGADHNASGCTLEPYSAANNSAPSVPLAVTPAPKAFAPYSTYAQRLAWGNAGLCKRCGVADHHANDCLLEPAKVSQISSIPVIPAVPVPVPPAPAPALKPAPVSKAAPKPAPPAPKPAPKPAPPAPKPAPKPSPKPAPTSAPKPAPKPVKKAQLCTICGINATQTCCECNSAHYCSLECQQTDRITHRFICHMYMHRNDDKKKDQERARLKYPERPTPSWVKTRYLALYLRTDQCAPEFRSWSFSKPPTIVEFGGVGDEKEEFENLEQVMEAALGGKVWMKGIRSNFTRNVRLEDSVVVVGLRGDEETKGLVNATALAFFEACNASIQPGIAKRVRQANRDHIIKLSKLDPGDELPETPAEDGLPAEIFRGPLFIIARVGHNGNEYRDVNPYDFRQFIDWANIRLDPLRTSLPSIHQRSRKIAGVRINSQKDVASGLPKYQTIYFPQDHPIYNTKTKTLWPDKPRLKIKRVVAQELAVTHHLNSLLVARDTNPTTWNSMDCIEELCWNKRKQCSWPFPKPSNEDKEPSTLQLKLMDVIIKKALSGCHIFIKDIEPFIRSHSAYTSEQDIKKILFAIEHLILRAEQMRMFGPISFATFKGIGDFNLQVSALQILADPLCQVGPNPSNVVKPGNKKMTLPEWMLPGGSCQVVREDKKDMNLREVMAICEFVVSHMDVKDMDLNGYWEMGREVVSRCCGSAGFARFLRGEMMSIGSVLAENPTHFPSHQIHDASDAMDIEDENDTTRTPGRKHSQLTIRSEKIDLHKPTKYTTANLGGTGKYNLSTLETIDLSEVKSTAAASEFVPDVDLTEDRSTTPVAADLVPGQTWRSMFSPDTWSKKSKRAKKNWYFRHGKLAELEAARQNSSTSRIGEPDAMDIDTDDMVARQARPVIVSPPLALVQSDVPAGSPSLLADDSYHPAADSMQLDDQDPSFADSLGATPVHSFSNNLVSKPLSKKDAAPQMTPIPTSNSKRPRAQSVTSELSEIEDVEMMDLQAETVSNNTTPTTSMEKDDPEKPGPSASSQGKGKKSTRACTTCLTKDCDKELSGCSACKKKGKAQCTYRATKSHPKITNVLTVGKTRNSKRQKISQETVVDDCEQEVQETVIDDCEQEVQEAAPSIDVKEDLPSAPHRPPSPPPPPPPPPLPANPAPAQVRRVGGTPRYDLIRIVDSKRVKWVIKGFDRGFHYALVFRNRVDGVEVTKWHSLKDLKGCDDQAAEFHAREPEKVYPTEEELKEAGLLDEEES